MERPLKRVNYASRSRMTNPEKRPNAFLAAILLVLSFSVAILIITQGTMGLVATADGRSQVIVAGTNSLAYSRQWGSYGGPIIPTGAAVDSSASLFTADAKNYAVYKLANDGSFAAPS